VCPGGGGGLLFLMADGDHMMMDKVQKKCNYNIRGMCHHILDTFNHLSGIGYTFVGWLVVIQLIKKFKICRFIIVETFLLKKLIIEIVLSHIPGTQP
jgi:hypothetical protein